MKFFKIGEYVQCLKEDNITCTCRWSTIHPNAYAEGKIICRHIQKLLRTLKENGL